MSYRKPKEPPRIGEMPRIGSDMTDKRTQDGGQGEQTGQSGQSGQNGQSSQNGSKAPGANWRSNYVPALLESEKNGKVSRASRVGICRHF